jgi:hypothetical protein
MQREFPNLHWEVLFLKDTHCQQIVIVTALCAALVVNCKVKGFGTNLKGRVWAARGALGC